MSATPILRFSDKNGQPFPEWESMFIGDYLTKKSIKQVPTDDAPLMSFVAHRGVVEKGDKYDRSHLVKSKDKKYKRTDLNDFIYSSNNLDVGSIGLNKHGSAVISEVYEIFSINDAANPDFISEVIQMPETIDKIIRFRQGCLYGQYKIYPEDFLDVEINMPTKEEQDKVATFLSLYDQKIENQMAKVEALETRRKGLLQQIFSQEIRFKADDGSEFPEWDSVIIEDAFDSISDKNHPDKTVLTIIQGQGTIPRNESDRNISYNKASIPTYKLVKENDFIMHLRSFEGGLEIATREGIVSPAYTILRSKVELVPEFYRYYFRSSSFIVEKLTGITEGIRDGRSINMDDFWLLEIPYPSIPEQRKIGRFMDLINRQIQIEKDKLEAIKQVKKGLLQQMFV